MGFGKAFSMVYEESFQVFLRTLLSAEANVVGNEVLTFPR